MPSTPKAPKVDAAALAANQQKQNTIAQRQSLVDQSNPYGDLSYTSSIDPVTGATVYKQSMNYNPQQQALLDEINKYKSTTGQTGNTLLNNTRSQYENAPDLSTGADSLVTQQMNRTAQYLNPYFDRERSQLDAKLRTQGITPNSPAYRQRMQEVTDNQSRQMGDFLAKYQPTAYNQALQTYQLPLQISQQLMQGAGPAGLQFGDTSAAKVNAVDYMKGSQIEQDAYKNQLAASQAKWNNIMAPISAVAGFAGGGPLGAAAMGTLTNSLFPGNYATGGKYNGPNDV